MNAPDKSLHDMLLPDIQGKPDHRELAINQVGVEDRVRDIALRLKQKTRIADWSVSSENFESIHNHSAYALIEGSNP